MDADTNLVSLRSVAETNWGEEPPTGPAPTMQAMRFTGDSLAYNKGQVTSNEIRSDRSVSSIIETGVTTEGAVNIELSCKTYKDWLEAALCGTWREIALTGLTLTITATTHKIARSAGDFTAAGGVKVGDWVKIGGTGIEANNIGPWKVTAVSALELTVADPDNLLTDDNVSAGTVTSSILINGVEKRSFLLEKFFTDIAKGIIFQGMRTTGVNLNFAAQQVVTGAFNFMGKTAKAVDATVSASVTDPTTTPVVSASADIGSLLKGNAALTAGLSAFTMNLTNNGRNKPFIGSKFSHDIGYGRCDITGNLTAFVEDLAMFGEVVNHSTVSLDIPVIDDLGNALIIGLPGLKITGNPQTTGGNTDVTLTADYQAQIDPTQGCMIKISAIDAA